jgi:hypothetical protein
VKLLDFGIAKVRADFGNVHTTTGTVLGTPSYFAPEQLLGREIDGRTDVHAAGIVLYEMLSGRRPFMEENPVDLTAAILQSAPPALEKLRPEIPMGLSLAVHDALAKDRVSRPTANELAKRLAPFGPRRSRIAPLFVVALAGAAAAGAVAWVSSEDVPVGAVPAPAKPAMVAPVDAPAPAAQVAQGVDRDAAALIEEARDAGRQGYVDRTRDLLKQAVASGRAEPEVVDWLAGLCDDADDDPCKEMLQRLYPSGAGARDGHLPDPDGRSGGGGAEVEVGADRVDPLP